MGLECGGGERPDAMPVVGMIVPVYNVKGYVERCIESILCQTIHDIEVVLVDDGSTDGSGAICDRYAAIDSRVRVVHKRNEGLSSARNDGVDASSAPYVLFADGDDWVEPTICERTYNAATQYDADIVLFLHYRISCDGSRHEAVTADLHEGIITEAEAMWFNTHVCCGSWLCLYRRELLDEARFPEGRLYEDVATTHRFFHAAKRICFVNEQLYDHLVDRPGSIMNSETINHPDRNEMVVSRIVDLNDWGYTEYSWRAALSHLATFGRDSAGGEVLEKVIYGIRGLPRELGWKGRVMLVAYRLSPKVFDTICILMGKR